MADEQDDDEGEVAAHGPRECMPCRGTGKVISGLGGKSSTVVCPWCGGDGVRHTSIDAQGKWLGGAGGTAGAL